MSRKLLYTLMLVALVFSSFSIAAAQEPDPYADVDPSGTEIVIWHNHPGHREEWLTEMAGEFNSTNEWGITLVLQNQGSYDDIREKMSAAIQSGDLPNLVVGYQNDQAFYEQAGVLVDLNELVYSEKWGLTTEEIDDFFQAFWIQDVHEAYGGQRLGFPPNRSMAMMYYNVEWLEELGYDSPPKTWPEFTEIACEATDEEAGTIGYAFYDSASNLATMVATRGGDIRGEEAGSYNFNTPEMIATLQWLQDLVNAGCAYTPSERYGDQADFANRKALFTMGSSSGMPYYEAAIEESELGPFEWDIAPMPTDEGVDEVVNVYGASISVVEAPPEQELASWLFLKYFTSPEVQAEWDKVSGYFPTRYSTADYLQDYMEENPLYARAYELLTTTENFFEPQFISYAEVRGLMDEASARVVQGEGVEEVAEWLQDSAEEAVEEFAE